MGFASPVRMYPCHVKNKNLIPPAEINLSFKRRFATSLFLRPTIEQKDNLGKTLFLLILKAEDSDRACQKKGFGRRASDAV